MKAIATPSKTKEILEKNGLKAKKGYGQNFLVDPVIVEKCAKESHCENSVIEIGAGIGGLTEQLAKYSKKVVAYEVDDALIPVLQDNLSEYENIEIIHEDFLESDIETLVHGLYNTYDGVSVCANLPYYITTPILFKLFATEEIEYITVMVQKEVGDRFVAKENDSEYSALSVEAQYLFDSKKLFTVPARSFNPSPKVDSIIVQFKRKENVGVKDIDKFFDFVRGCFKQRRKTIYNNLREYDDTLDVDSVLERSGIDKKKRAQELTVEELERLYKDIYEG